MNIKAMFKAERTLRWTLMRVGPVRDEQSRKQFVCNIPSNECRYYTVETCRPLKVRIKEHKYNLTLILLKKLKLAKCVHLKATKCVGKKPRPCRLKQNTTYWQYRGSADMSGRASDQSPNFHNFPSWTPIIAAEARKLHLCAM